MHQHNKKKIVLVTKTILLILIFAQLGCKKYLEAIPDKSLTIPKNLGELQGLLDYPESNLASPAAAELSSDNIYLPLEDWNYFFVADDRLAYIWENASDLNKDWQPGYKKIFKTNVVLEALNSFQHLQGTDEFKNIKGSALFLRALNFYELAQLFAPPYSSLSAPLPFGIPLKVSADINEKTVRSTIGETYSKIIEDGKESIPLLPSSTTYRTRPSKIAAYALLARTYLVMHDYVNAGKYADSSLLLNDELINYNDLSRVDPQAEVPFKRLNEEVIFQGVTRNIVELLRSKVDTNLVKLYHADDIRKKAFFKTNQDGSYHFKGNYDGSGTVTFFSGITTPEMYLIRSECYARANEANKALDDLNTILMTRWSTGTFTPLVASDSQEALKIILEERRKELCFRASLRWSDLRRLNTDTKFAITLYRNLNGQTYTLPPNDNRYTLFIPDDVIDVSGIPQNPR